MKLVSITPTIFLRGFEDALEQRFEVTLAGASVAESAELAFILPDGERIVSLRPTPGAEWHGDCYLEARLAPLVRRVLLRSGGSVASQVEVSWHAARRWEVHLVQTSHHDLGYTDLPSNVLGDHVRWLDEALEFANQTQSMPEPARFRIVIEQAWSLEHYLKQASPQNAGRMVDLLRCGQFEVTALYGNLVTHLLSGEELLRALYLSFRLKRQHGIPITSAEHNDIPGISWGVCQALTGAGVRIFIPGLPLYYEWGYQGLESFWDVEAVFGSRQPGAFWWVAPSGRRLLVWCNNSGCGGPSRTSLPGLAEKLQELEASAYPFPVLRWPVIGADRDNSPYEPGFCATVQTWNERWAYPRLRLSTNAAFYASLGKRDLSQLPVWRGELPDQDYPTGSTSTAAATALNRRSHSAITAAEALNSLSQRLAGDSYRQNALDQAWQDALLFDEHTWGFHFPAGPAMGAARAEKLVHAHRAAALAHDVLNKAMAFVADRVNPVLEGIPLVVFNPCGWARDGVVRASLREMDNCGSEIISKPPELDPQGIGYRRGVLLTDRYHLNLPQVYIEGRFNLVDAETKQKVPFQIEEINEAVAALSDAPERLGLGSGTRRYGQFELPEGVRRELCFIATNLPPLGYKTYLLVQTDTAARKPRSTRRSVIENEHYRVELDLTRGTVASLVDKETGSELVDDGCPYGFHALVIRDPAGMEWQMEHIRRLPGEFGPVCQALEVSGTAHGHPLVRQTIRLFDGIKQVEFSTRLLKDVTPLLEGYLAFPFKVAQPAFRYEGVLAALEPLVDFLPGGQSDALAVQNWVKVQGKDITVLWSPLDAPLVSLGGLRHAYVSPAHRNQVTDDIHRRRRLVKADYAKGWIFSNILYNNFGTNFYTTQPGDICFTYRVTTRSRPLTDADSVKAGSEATAPLSAILARSQPGASLPLVGSLLQVESDQVLLTAAKRADDGSGWVLRLWNPDPEDAGAYLRFGKGKFAGAYACSAAEESQERLAVGEDGLGVIVPGRDVVTLRLVGT